MLAILTGAFLVLIGVIRYRLRHRPAVAADPLRLPERHRFGRDRLRSCRRCSATRWTPRERYGKLVAFAEGLGEGQVVLPALLIWIGLDRPWSSSCAGWRRACRACSSRSLCPWLRSRSSGSTDEIAVIGSLPRGLPSFELPLVRDLRPAVRSPRQRSASPSLPSRIRACCPARSLHGSVDDVNPNHEVIALGSCERWRPDLFQGFPISEQRFADAGRRVCRRPDAADRTRRVPP